MCTVECLATLVRIIDSRDASRVILWYSALALSFDAISFSVRRSLAGANRVLVSLADSTAALYSHFFSPVSEGGDGESMTFFLRETGDEPGE